MSTQVADIFVKVGAKIGEFNAAMVSVETKLNTLSKQLKLDVKADSTNVLTMVRELKTLEAEAKRLQSGVLILQVKNADPAAIKAMDDQLAGVARRMEILNAAIADNQQKWQKLADVGNKLTMGITAPLVAAATAIGAFAVKTADLSEKLDNMSKQTGLNTTLLQQLKFVADQSGLSFEAIANASTMVQRKLMGVEQDTGNVAEAFKRLGVNARGSDGQLRSMNELFPELIRALQNMGNATERTMLASQIFGRGASDLLPILAMSATEFENAKNRASEFGLVLDTDALAAAGRMDAAMDDLKSRFVGITQQLAMSFMPILTDSVIPALESAVKWVRGLVEWFGDLNPETKKLIVTMLALTAALGPLISLIAQLGLAIPALSKAFIWLAANPIVAVIAALALLGVGIYAIVNAQKTLAAQEADNTEAAIENVNARKAQIENAKKMISEYETLRDKNDKTNVELDRMNSLLSQIRTIAPEVVSGNQLIGNSMGVLSGQTQAATEELRLLQMQRLRDLATAQAVKEEEARQNIESQRNPVGAVETVAAQWRIITGSADAFIRANEARITAAQARQRTLQAELLDLQHSGGAASSGGVASSTGITADDQAKADAINEAVAIRNAGRLEKITLEMNKAIREAQTREVAAGEAEIAAIRSDYIDRYTEMEMTILKEGEALRNIETDKQIKDTKDRYSAIAKNALDEDTASQNMRLSQYKEFIGEWIDETSKQYDPRFVTAQGAKSTATAENELSLSQKLGDLARNAAIGENTAAREADIWQSFREKQIAIDRTYAGAVINIRADIAKKTNEAQQTEITTQMSAWQKATSYLQEYSDRLVGILYGETAMRIAQFDRQRAAERKAFDESIADAELKAEILSAYDADTMAQRAAMGQQEDTRNDERMDMLQQLSQMTGAGSVESLWRKMAESSLQVAFAGPQMPQSPQMIGMGAGMGGDVGGKLQATNATLDKAYEAQVASARSLKSLENAIAGTQ
jgi:hypothetical protein